MCTLETIKTNFYLYWEHLRHIGRIPNRKPSRLQPLNWIPLGGTVTTSKFGTCVLSNCYANIVHGDQKGREIMKHFSYLETDPLLLLIMLGKSPVTADNVRKMLRTSIQQCRMDSMIYGTQSLHTGRAVDLYNLGVGVESIKFLGRWHSTAIYNYLKN